MPCSMKIELGELQAQHDTDASLILEWQETSRNLERQCLQQQMEVDDLKSLLSRYRNEETPAKQQSPAQR